MAKKQKNILETVYDYQVRLQGIANSLGIQLATLISSTDDEVVKLLKKELTKKVAGSSAKDIKKELVRLKNLISVIANIRKSSFDLAKDLLFSTSADVIKTGTDETAKEFNQSLGEQARKEREERFCKTLTDEQQHAILDYQTIDGKTIGEWFDNWQRSDIERISNAVQRASVEEMSIGNITKIIRGTRENNFTDGILATSKNSAVTLARTVVNGVSNNARVETIKENQDVIDGVKFVGTLDGKTCIYCASLDGKVWKGQEMGQARRPPIHPNCRCTLIPYIDLKFEDGTVADLDGDRPAANADFDQLAKDAYNKHAREMGWKRRWNDLSSSTRLKYYYQAQKDYERDTGNKAYEQRDGSYTFAEYFKNQSSEFKRSWLGAKRYDLYEQGKLTEEQLFKPSILYQTNTSELFKVVKENGVDEATQLQNLIELNSKTNERVKRLRDGFPSSLDEIVKEQQAGGSTGAMIVETAYGSKFIRKNGSSTSNEHLQNECNTDAFYRACGVNVPEFKTFTQSDSNGNQETVKLSKFIEGGISLNDWWQKASASERTQMSEQLRKSFAVDILLGNWDVVGLGADNILVDKNGIAWRIDNGGSLGFRAQGQRKRQQDWDSGMIDDLWTMTGNGSRIGSNVSSTIPKYLGYGLPNGLSILDLANDISSRDWSNAIAVLPPDQQTIIKKRLAEFKEIAVRGTGFIDNGYTNEYTDGILDSSYSYSKKGLREACDFIADLENNEYEWFRDNNHSNGNSLQNTYNNLSDFLRAEIGNEAVDYIEDCNSDQGGDSYNPKSCETKILRMRAVGIDIFSYNTFEELRDDLINKDFGYYLGIPNGPSPTCTHFKNLKNAFDSFKKDPTLFDKRFKEQMKYNAGIQIALENAEFTGNDKQNRSLILMRTENAYVVSHYPDGTQAQINEGDDCVNYVGVNESHSIIKVVVAFGGPLTMVRVPYSCINGLYMMSSHHGKMYYGDYENEISADTHNLRRILIENNPSKNDSVNLYVPKFLTAEKKNTP